MPNKIKKPTQKEMMEEMQALEMLQGSLLSRAKALNNAGIQFRGERDLFSILGYPDRLTFQNFYSQYRRHDLAKAIIDKPIEYTWRGDLTILEADDETTLLEQEWMDMLRQLKLKSVFSRIDRLASLGRYGVILLGFDDTRTPADFSQPPSGNRKLVYVRPLAETQALVDSTETNPTMERYGMPTFYELQGESPIRIHYSRVIHIPSEVLDDEVYGIPRLEAVYNRLMDLEKIIGGSAEMFWRGAYPGYQGAVEDDFNLSPERKEQLQEQLQEYEHGLRRFLINKGITLEALRSEVADPAGHVDVQLQMISASTGIPKRILVGSERGELASSEDQNNWFDKVESRREDFAETWIVRPFIERCIEFGALSKPKKEQFTIEWTELRSIGKKEQAEVGLTRSRSIGEYAKEPTAMDVLPPDSFYKLILQLSDEEISIIQQERNKMIADESDDFQDADDEEETDEEETDEEETDEEETE